jgi:2-polyprenyl-3-methyl-5-hydroxy-6-metoxy-1,4-benzoquinol methylase
LRRGRITAAYVSLAGKLVLDFGSGNGAQTVELSKQGGQIVACDIDSGDLGVLADYVKRHNITSVTPVLYDGHRLPGADGQFDVVVSFAVLEHVNDEANALDDIHRVLKPSGDFVISVPNKWWVFETHGARLPLLPWNRVPFFSWLPKSIHKRFAMARIYTKRQILDLLRKQGFDILGVCYMTAPMDAVKSPAIQKLLRRIIFRGDRTTLPVLATEIFVHCQKNQFIGSAA